MKMIERKESWHKGWVVLDEDGAIIGDICADSGEVLIRIDTLAPDLSLTKEFHQALGEAIQIAEAQNNEND
jgi:hypothetical protein